MKKRSMVCRLGKFPQLTRTVFTSADGLASDNITALCYGADNCLYVGTDRGLSKIDGKKITTVDIGIENAPISMLFCANDGHIFVGTGKSIIELSGKKIIASREFSSDAVAMKQDCDNVTWILTKTVLYRFPQGAKEFDLKIGVPGKGSCIARFRQQQSLCRNRERRSPCARRQEMALVGAHGGRDRNTQQQHILPRH